MVGGYTGKLLYIDLCIQKIEEKPLDYEQARIFIGGRGLGAKILWDSTKAGNDPLGPHNPLIFLTGPLTGMGPGAAQTAVMAKSPATGITLGHAMVGAHWGTELKLAGYDGLVITGQSEYPVYLTIYNNQVRIEKADEVWGLSTQSTEQKLRLKAGDVNARVLSIGPAGEAQVLFASINQELFHAAARGGMGAVMGSKKLKAIVVRGTGKLVASHPDVFMKTRSKILQNFLDMRTTTRRGYKLMRWGSTISSVAHSDHSELDVRNYREAHWPNIDKVSGLAYERQIAVKVRSCFSCPVCCHQLGIIKEGPFQGYLTNPDFDSSGTIGPGLLVEDVNAVAYLSRLGDELGMDDSSLGNVTGFAMECYEKGVLTKSDLDGIDLTWGNVEAIQQLWYKIAKGEGIGRLLGQGVKRAAEVLGQGSEKYAMHVKGLEFAGYAPQAHHDRALQYAVGDRGGCHHYGLTLDDQNKRVWADSMTSCTWHHAFVNTSDYLELLNAVTGWDYRVENWVQDAERLLLMARCYNLREGMSPERDDVLPVRVHEEPLTWGPKAGAFYPHEKFIRDRANFYQQRGCDEAGYPKRDHLEKLGLGFAWQESPYLR